MKLLLLDILIYNLTPYSSYFFLIAPIFTSKKDWLKIILIGLIIDNVILNTYFVNTAIFIVIFLINKHIFKFYSRSFFNYFLVANFNFIFYYFILSAIYHFDLMLFVNAYFLNTAFLICSYNLCKKYIKLSR